MSRGSGDNLAGLKAEAASPRPKSFSNSRAQPRVGEIGYMAKESVQNGVDRRHYLQYHPETHAGLHGAHVNAMNNFTRLPGITFNDKSFSAFVDTATVLRSSMQLGTPNRAKSSSPMRRPAPR